MTTGERIKARRKELGITADKVAEQIGVSRSTMFRYEKGEIEKIPINNLVPIARALHTTVGYLMGWSDEKTPSPLPRMERMQRLCTILIAFRRIRRWRH